MRVLAIAGSPRRNGNTDILLAELLRGAADKGAETKTIVLNKMKFVGCQHCDACLKDGNCILKDDMQEIYPEFEQADVIVLATPMQFMAMTAPVKAMIDRFQCRWARKYVLKIPPLGDNKPRKGFLVAIGGMRFKNLFDAVLLVVKSFFLILNIEYAGDILLRNIDEKGAIKNHPDALQKAYETGQKLAEGTYDQAESGTV
ncbi:MAG: flavodoxin family protein [Dehalococcoidales bacterium]|nr:flavodoxin family protein [Dehalococcoidales bacterium]